MNDDLKYVLAKLRKKGVDLQSIANASGLNRRTLYRISIGENMPTFDTVEKLKKQFKKLESK